MPTPAPKPLSSRKWKDALGILADCWENYAIGK